MKQNMDISLNKHVVDQLSGLNIQLNDPEKFCFDLEPFVQYIK